MKQTGLRNFRRLQQWLALPLIFLFSCSPTRHVPDGSYLLDKVEIRTDASEVNKRDLTEYLRQTTNSYILGVFRMQLGIYNLSGNDTTHWFNKFTRRVGQAPVILDTMLTSISANQLLSYHINKGYYNATIKTSIDERKKKRAKVIYEIQSGEPYRVGTYKVDVPYKGLEEIAADSVRSLIQPETLFDVYSLNQERDRVAGQMRRRGYYNFTRDMLSYRADSAEMKVAVTMELRDFLKRRQDTLSKTIFKKYSVSRIIYTINPSVSSLTAGTQTYNTDTVVEGRYMLIGPEKKIFTLKALVAGTFIKPGSLYSDADVERTYSQLNALPPVKYTHISFAESSPDSLDCHITIAEAKSLSVSSRAEVTFTDGYWGGALNLGTVNRNLFRGAESLSFTGRVALERQEDVIAQEWGAQAGVKVPRIILPYVDKMSDFRFYGNTEFRSTFNYQYRPGEFSSTNVGGGIKYNWSNARQNQVLDLLDLSYVYFPWISTAFRDSFLVTGKYNKYNYDDYLIMRISYSASYSGFNAARPMRNYLTYRYGFETAGNLLYGINKLFHSPTDNEGSYRVFNIRYSQYIKGEFNTSYHHIIDKNNRIVYHLGMGLGVPYGNAEIIPFERRFYSGGANSIRGWSESTLGPGTYERFSSRRRDYNQVGDIKLDMNMEYRGKMFWVLEGALFLDAGNIWTIRDYENQPGGVFRFGTFSKQIALAYGAGVRMDFDFLLLRIDLGLKLFDPAARTNQWKVLPTWDDLALNLAIGYPF